MAEDSDLLVVQHEHRLVFANLRFAVNSEKGAKSFQLRVPDKVKAQFPQFKAVETYGELMGLVKGAMG